MSGGFETVELIDTYFYGRLSGDVALTALVGDRIVGTLSTAEVPNPYVVFGLASARDVHGNAGQRIQVDAIYFAKAVGSGASWSTVLPIAKRLDVLLPTPVGMSVDVAGGSLSCVRTTIIQYAEVDEGMHFRHLGAQFRVRANSL